MYHIKEAALAELVAFAVGAQKGTEPHQKLVNWRKTQKGIFLDVVKEVRAGSCMQDTERCAFDSGFFFALLCRWCRASLAKA